MNFLLRRIAAHLLITSAVFLVTKLSFAQVPASDSQLARFVPPWSLDGQTYLSYAGLRDDLASAIRSATTKVLLATYAFSDGDLASALYTAHTRGVFVGLLVDELESKKHSAYQNLLIKQKVFLFQTKLSRFPMEGLTTVVIDNSVWRVSSRLDEKTPGNVRIDRSPFTSDEVLDWFKRPKQKPASPAAEPTPKRPESAKTPTKELRPSAKIFGTIPKEKNSVSKPEKAIPMKLPSQTRIQKMRKGLSTEESSASDAGAVPSFTPPPSSREGELDSSF